MELFKGFIPVCKLLLEANAELFRYLASLWRCICYSAQRFSLSHVSICSQSCQHQQLITYANFLGSKRRAKLLLVLKSISQNLNYKKFREIDPTDHDYLRTCHPIVQWPYCARHAQVVGGSSGSIMLTLYAVFLKINKVS